MGSSQSARAEERTSNLERNSSPSNNDRSRHANSETIEEETHTDSESSQVNNSCIHEESTRQEGAIVSECEQDENGQNESDEHKPLVDAEQLQWRNRSQSLSNCNRNANESEGEADLERFFRELGLIEGRLSTDLSLARTDDATIATGTTTIDPEDWFIPEHCKDFQWMGKSLESLISGYARVAPILESQQQTPKNEASKTKTKGPNVSLTLLAREISGKTVQPHNVLPASERLAAMGGSSLYDALDRPSDGMCSEVAALERAIDEGDWTRTQTIISKLAPRLIGDPTFALSSSQGNQSGVHRSSDPNLPPNTPKFYAGGGRIGLERDAFVLAGGIDVMVRVFREPCFVGMKMARTHDARDLSKELVATNRLAHCWNEVISCIRELVFSMPKLLKTERIFDLEKDSFLPFLFTLLSHDYFFEGAAHLIEEILSIQSHAPQIEEEATASASQQQQPIPTNSVSTELNNTTNNDIDGREADTNEVHATSSLEEEIENHQFNKMQRARVAFPTTFFLGNVPNLYSLWQGFSCRQLAHFCRILALLIFEPEDRQLLESNSILKSIELLKLRKNRAARAGKDSTVDQNQSIVLGDERILRRFLDILGIMNYGPSLRRSSAFHLISQFPFIADTLMMLGLRELEKWSDVNRYDEQARSKLSIPGEHRNLHELGAVAGMLESLSTTFMNSNGGGSATNQLGHIISVISAAQQAGVVVGRSRQQASTVSETSRSNSVMSGRRVVALNNDVNDNDEHNGSQYRDSSVGSFTSSSGMFSDQMFLRHQDHSRNNDSNENGTTSVTPDHSRQSLRLREATSDDAANILQFNALLLSPYQVEVLFVLCTLLGGRRKIDAQEILKHHGITQILDEMFQRLPWDSLSPTREPLLQQNQENPQQQRTNFGSSSLNENNEEQYGIHGPGCECTPESALCIQYLRLLHNFCDRDCDNYYGRRQLLSKEERNFIFGEQAIQSANGNYGISGLPPGLLSKIIAAFFGESDESPYRFWLASCVESFLRGSSAVEQVFVARTGLMEHLINDVISPRLHCAGSLQTSFDLLGELCKGNIEVLKLLASFLDTEEKFRKLMNVAASNLVDSNVFIRSLILALERIPCEGRFHDATYSNVETKMEEWKTYNQVRARGFLTHSWWDVHAIDAVVLGSSETASRAAHDDSLECEVNSDRNRPSDWFPMVMNVRNAEAALLDEVPVQTPLSCDGSSIHDHIRFGWVFKPKDDTSSASTNAQEPNSIGRLSWFLSTNRTRLLRDLLEVVNLKNINHENICCLNTAVVIAIFAYRRSELQLLLQNLKQLNNEDATMVQQARERREGGGSGIDHQRDSLQNFREVLWFWIEYYTHRGRDRLSLEFSSRLRFQEWMEVVNLLAADDDTPTSLVRRPLNLPQSPYQRRVS